MRSSIVRKKKLLEEWRWCSSYNVVLARVGTRWREICCYGDIVCTLSTEKWRKVKFMLKMREFFQVFFSINVRVKYDILVLWYWLSLLLRAHSLSTFILFLSISKKNENKNLFKWSMATCVLCLWPPIPYSLATPSINT